MPVAGNASKNMRSVGVVAEGAVSDAADVVVVGADVGADVVDVVDAVDGAAAADAVDERCSTVANEDDVVLAAWEEDPVAGGGDDAAA